MNILVGEDDAEIFTFVMRGLRRAGYTVDCANDGLAGEKMARAAIYDATIVDLMLPDQDGLTLIAHLRDARLRTPIIVLSVNRSSSDKVSCLRRGADEYLSKPFEMPELLARIEAVLRRSGETPISELLENSGVTVGLVGRTMRRDGQKIDFPPREFSLLELLMRNAGRPLAKSYPLERLSVSGDAGALRRVCANLLDNAIKYIPAGGRVRITADRTDQSVAVHFTDTGCNISAEDLPRIWARLFRGDRSRTERGLGLGLSFVRAIFESHGGKATVTSQPDGGTTSSIKLPAPGAECPQSQSDPHPTNASA